VPLSVAVRADRYPAAVDRELRRAAASDRGVVQPQRAVDPGADQADGAVSDEAIVTRQAAIDHHVVCGQRYGTLLPAAEVGALQLDITMNMSSGEIHRPGCRD